MNRPFKLVIAIFVLVLLTMSGLSGGLAKGKEGKGSKGKGKEKQKTSQTTEAKSTPPGWSKGRKTGWQGGRYPPGWSKWNERKRAKWQTDRREAVSEVESVSDRYDISEKKQSEVIQAFDEAITGGKMIGEARTKLIGALKDKEQRKTLMIDTAQSVLDLLR